MNAPIQNLPPFFERLGYALLPIAIVLALYFLAGWVFRRYFPAPKDTETKDGD